MIFRILAIILGLLVAQYASAATITLSECSQAALNAAIAASASGDTLQFPAGSCSVTFSTSATRIYMGAPNHATTITGGWMPIRGTASRISGFRIDNTIIEAEGAGFVIDNNIHTMPAWTDCVKIRQFASGSATPSLNSGLVIRNTYTNCRVNEEGTAYGSSDDQQLRQNFLWSLPASKGGSDTLNDPDALYIIENVFNLSTAGNYNYIDINYGGRFVAMYNTLNHGGFLESHGKQEGGNRSGRLWISIGNITDNSNNSYPSAPGSLNGGFSHRYRGGTGLVALNVHPGTWSNVGIPIDNVRDNQNNSGNTTPPNFGFADGICDGTHAIDENQTGLGGYRCRDGIGAGRDTGTIAANPLLWSATPQQLQPAYFFGNRGAANGGVNFPVLVLSWSDARGHIQANRDYYDYSPSFSGSTGVGIGPIASRPTTCTAGVGYFATSQNYTDLTPFVGANHTQDIEGTFYVCGSGNTWTQYYIVRNTHPLDPGGGAPANVPPTVSITAPTNGATHVIGSTLALAATASDSDGTVTQVEFQANGVTFGGDLTSPYSVGWNPLSPGTFTLTAVATDNSGATTTSSPITVTVTAAPDTTNPVVSITTPSNEATVSSAISVAATCTDNVAVAFVQFRLDGVNLGSADTSSPYSVTWDTTTATNGAHTLTAVCSDSSNNTATSSPITVTVNNVAQPPASACPGVIVPGN